MEVKNYTYVILYQRISSVYYLSSQKLQHVRDIVFIAYFKNNLLGSINYNCYFYQISIQYTKLLIHNFSRIFR